jgi:hypothetical protein
VLVEHEIGREEPQRRLTTVDKVVEWRRKKEYGCARGNRRREKLTRRVPKPKRGVRAGSKQLLVVDSVRGGSGGQRRDASTRGGSSGVG